MTAAPKKPGKRPKEADGVEPGDHVYVRHPERGPIAVKVLATGEHGLTGRCDQKQRHRVTWDRLLGHKARMLRSYRVVDQGADGAILADEKGRRRFLAGEAPAPAERASEEASSRASTGASAQQDDPLTGGLDRLAKAETHAMPMPDAPILFLKAAGARIANRAGLMLRDTTDRSGKHTKRWMRSGAGAPSDRGPGGAGGRSELIHDHRQTDLEDFTGRAGQPQDKAMERAPMQHGDHVRFRHGDVEGTGHIMASGADGVTLRGKDGQTHQVRHEHLIGKAEEASGDGEGKGGEAFHAAEFYAKADTPGADAEMVLQGFPPDTESKIAATIERLGGVEETYKTHMKDGAYTPERQALHDQIIGAILSEERIAAATPKNGKPTFTILGGRGGSGKSWFKGQVYDPEQAIVLDADEIKHKLPEYQGWNAFQVHEESGHIFDRMTEMATEMGLNLVHDATMKTASKAQKLVKHFKDQGYRVEAHYMHLPRMEAAKRAVKRFLGPTGRFVPPEVILSNTGNEAAFDSIKGLVDRWSFRDNTNSDGKGPKLIAEGGENAGEDDGRDGREDGRHGRPGADGEQSGAGSGADRGADREAQGGEDRLGKALAAARLILFRAGPPPWPC